MIAFVENAYIGGLEDVRTVNVMMIFGQKMIHTTRLIQGSHQEHCGLIGTNQENRRTGAVVELSIRRTIVSRL